MHRLKTKETFKESIVALLTTQVVIKSLGLFYRLYLTNRNNFGDEGNAISSAGFQIYALILSLTAVGIPNAISKIIAKKSSIGDHRSAHKIFKTSLTIFSLLGIIGSYLLFYYAPIIANNYLHIKEASLSIIALSPSILFVAVNSVFRGYFNGREQIKKSAHAQSMNQIIKTISVIGTIELSVFLSNQENTEIMAACSNLATTIGNFIEFVYLLLLYKKNLAEIKSEIKNSVNSVGIRIKDVVKEVLEVAIPITLAALITTVSKNIDSITVVNGLKDIIGYESAKREYGILSGKVDALINFPLSFNMAIASALLPTIAANSDNIKSKEKRINKAFLLEMCISIFTATLFIMFADKILSVLFPNAKDGGAILQISSLSIVLITIEQINNNILHGIGKTKIPIIAITLGVIVKAILNQILIGRQNIYFGGTKGAALATVICHAIAGLYSFIAMIKYTKLKIKAKNFLIPLIASMLICIIAKIIFLLITH